MRDFQQLGGLACGYDGRAIFCARCLIFHRETLIIQRAYSTITS